MERKRVLEAGDLTLGVPSRDERRDHLVHRDEREPHEQREPERRGVERDLARGRDRTDDEEIELGEDRPPDRRRPHRRLERVAQREACLLGVAQLAARR